MSTTYYGLANPVENIIYRKTGNTYHIYLYCKDKVSGHVAFHNREDALAFLNLFRGEAVAHRAWRGKGEGRTLFLHADTNVKLSDGVLDGDSGELVNLIDIPVDTIHFNWDDKGDYNNNQ